VESVRGFCSEERYHCNIDCNIELATLHSSTDRLDFFFLVDSRKNALMLDWHISRSYE
jgi:hypothetical protein